MLLLSLLFNGLFYKLHPMRLIMYPKGKLQTHLCGVMTCTCWTEPEEEFDGKYLVLFDFFFLSTTFIKLEQALKTPTNPTR